MAFNQRITPQFWKVASLIFEYREELYTHSIYGFLLEVAASKLNRHLKGKKEEITRCEEERACAVRGKVRIHRWPLLRSRSGKSTWRVKGRENEKKSKYART